MYGGPVNNIGVTGANGFVAKALVNALSQRIGIGVTAITRQETDVVMRRVRKCVVPGGVPDPEFFLDLDGVVHTAARVHVMHETSGDPLQEFRKVNVDATLAIARNAAAAGVRRFVFISSAKVNGEVTFPGKPFTETDKPSLLDAYAISKWEAELGLAEISRQTSMEVVIIRPPLVYGPGVKANFASLMKAVRHGIPLPLKAVHNSRSLIGLENLVDFISVCISHSKAANQTFLVSDGFDVSTSVLVRTMAQAIGLPDRQFSVPVPLLKLAGRLSGKAAMIERLCGNLQVDITKAQTLLGWAPPVSFEDGIRNAMLGKS